MAPCAGMSAEQREAAAPSRCQGCFAIFVAATTMVALVSRSWLCDQFAGAWGGDGVAELLEFDGEH